MSLSNFDLNQNYYSFNENNSTPIVFIHGVGLDHQMWEPQIEAFKNYSTLTYDLLGHGKTPWTKENLDFEDFSNQLNQLLNHLKFKKDLFSWFFFGLFNCS
jgi:pimeloyl-ACP methyl ester carboxylesterase